MHNLIQIDGPHNWFSIGWINYIDLINSEEILILSQQSLTCAKCKVYYNQISQGVIILKHNYVHVYKLNEFLLFTGSSK